MMKHSIYLAPVLGVTLAACASTQPGLSAEDKQNTELEPAVCTDQFDMTAPVSLDAIEPSGMEIRNLYLDDQATCVTSARGHSVPYGVLALPTAPNAASVSIAALGQPGSGVFAPHVRLLTADGSTTRVIGADRFAWRGTGLAIVLRPRVGETHAIVSLDETWLGREVDGPAADPNYLPEWDLVPEDEAEDTGDKPVGLEPAEYTPRVYGDRGVINVRAYYFEPEAD